MKSKKAQTFSLKFLVNLILALVLFIPAIMFAGKFFNLSSDALESFYKLVGTMERMAASDELMMKEKVLLKMDPGSNIVFFEKKSLVFDWEDKEYKIGDYIYLMQKDCNWIDNSCFEYLSGYCIPRPEECGDGPCVCLYRNSEFKPFDSSTLSEFEKYKCNAGLLYYREKYNDMEGYDLKNNMRKWFGCYIYFLIIFCKIN